MHNISTDIYILSETIQRASVIKTLIGDDVVTDSEITVIHKNEINPDSLPDSEAIFLVDLISYRDASRKIISKLKTAAPNCKIIALHIYRTPLLIDPLFESGIDGYIHSDPSRKELLNAIEKVDNGEIYRPEIAKDS